MVEMNVKNGVLVIMLYEEKMQIVGFEFIYSS